MNEETSMYYPPSETCPEHTTTEPAAEGASTTITRWKSAPDCVKCLRIELQLTQRTLDECMKMLKAMVLQTLQTDVYVTAEAMADSEHHTIGWGPARENRDARVVYVTPAALASEM